MKRVWPALALCLAAAAAPLAASAQDDPLHSTACRQALDALQVAEAAETAHAPAANGAARLQPLRQRAARACLGGSAGPAPSQRSVRPPISVAPVVIAPPAAPRALPPVPEVTLPRPVLPPTVVLHCDSTSCTASDGSTLQRAGTALIGPRGMCRLEGNVLVCP